MIINQQPIKKKKKESVKVIHLRLRGELLRRVETERKRLEEHDIALVIWNVLYKHFKLTKEINYPPKKEEKTLMKNPTKKGLGFLL